MRLMDDLKKVFLKHSIIQYLSYAELDDEVYQLILDKNLELALAENKRLKEENMKLKLEGLLEEQATIDVEIGGKNTPLTKEELIQLVGKYKEKELVESAPIDLRENVFIPEDIVGITTHEYNIEKFYVHYEDDFGKKRSLISSSGPDKYALYFDLFNLSIIGIYRVLDNFVLANKKHETITISTKTTVSNEFLQNFSKGMEFIQKK